MKIRFIASPKRSAQAVLDELTILYGQAPPSEADYIVAVGGDGTVLQALHGALANARQPVFGMRLEGSVGALANRYSLHALPRRLQRARRIVIHPLKAEATCGDGEVQTVFAINEVVFSRQRLQAAKMQVTADAREYPLIIGDGLIIASAVGSSGYNQSAGGPCLPYDASKLALTAISPRRCSRWSNAVADDTACIDVEIIDPDFRPVRLETTMSELRNVRRTRLSCCRDVELILLFDRTDF